MLDVEDDTEVADKVDILIERLVRYEIGHFGAMSPIDSKESDNTPALVLLDGSNNRACTTALLVVKFSVV